MSTQNELLAIGATRIAVGMSSIIKCSPTAYSFGINLKILSGGGTLEIVSSPPSLTGASSAVHGTGYPVGASESVTFDGPATFYLLATGATMVCTVLLGRTAGASFI